MLIVCNIEYIVYCLFMIYDCCDCFFSIHNNQSNVFRTQEFSFVSILFNV